jgi:phage shock protein E
MIRILLLSLVLMAQPALAAVELTPAPVAKVAGRYVIDVRTQKEWDQGHVEGALFIPHDVIGARIEQVLPDRGAPIALYCGSGVRSGKALETLKAMGYRNLENLGGLEDARRKLEAQH